MPAPISPAMSVITTDKITIEIAGENSLIIYFNQSYGEKTLAKVQQASQWIRQYMAAEIIDLVASYASIMVMFNLLEHDHQYIRDKLYALISRDNSQKHTANIDKSASIQQTKVVELPVYYSIESGPDLAAIAKQAKLSIAQVIAIHQAQQYRVYAIGFAPGFAYLGDVDQRIATPRLSSPRLSVAKGAVAIADRQTAVYPNASPGGWNIIGLCPVNMFDAEASPTMLVQVGDQIKFKAISKSDFIALGGILPINTGGTK